MTLDAFLVALAEVSGNFRWSYISDIRGLEVVDCELRCFCPVTAVCWAKFGKYFQPNAVHEAGELLGLPMQDIFLIVDAADFATTRQAVKDLRARLKDAIVVKPGAA